MLASSDDHKITDARVQGSTLTQSTSLSVLGLELELSFANEEKVVPPSQFPFVKLKS